MVEQFATALSAHRWQPRGGLAAAEGRQDSPPDEWEHEAGASRRREFCHFDDTPLSVSVETPAEGREGVQQNDRTLADG